jgi:Flp pilus assembly secretin CpaC
MKTTIAILLVTGTCGWSELALAQAGQAAAPPPPTAAGATNGRTAETAPAGAPAAAGERFPITLRLPPLAIIGALAEAGQLEVEVDARINNGLDAAGNPIPNWTEPVFRQWENKTARDALEEFLAGYKLVLVAQPGTKKFLVTYPEAAPKPEAGPAVAQEPLDRVLEMLSLDESVPEAIRTVAAKGKMNISIDPAVAVACQPLGKGPDNKEMPALTNKVVETWQNITVRGALEALMAPRGLMLVQYSNTPIPTVTFKPTNEPISRVITLKYANVTNLASVLTNAVSAAIKVKEDTRTSSLIIRATEKEFEAIEALLAKLDVPTRNVLIEAQIVETSRKPEAIRGIDWTKTLQNQELLGGFGQKQTTVTPGTPTTTVGPGGRVITVPGVPTSATTFKFDPLDPTVLMSTASKLNPNFGFLTAQGLNAVLSFLNTDSDSRMLATPRAVTLDNQETRLEVTTAIPIFESSQSQGAAGTTLSTTKPNYTNVGTILIVTPRITGTNIMLSLKPEISEVGAEPYKRLIAGQENEADYFTSTKVQAQVIVPSGNTLVMGGLIRDRTVKSYTKVPLLGDLPLLGLAFRHESRKRERYNLLIFVTPTIVGEGDYQPATKEFLKTPKVKMPEDEDSAWDAGKPYNWKKGLEPLND